MSSNYDATMGVPEKTVLGKHSRDANDSVAPDRRVINRHEIINEHTINMSDISLEERRSLMEWFSNPVLQIPFHVIGLLQHIGLGNLISGN